MSRNKPLQGPCQHCQGSISFPVENVGTVASCPHCGKSTELMIPVPEIAPAISRRAVVWMAIALVILLGGLAGLSFALNKAKSLKQSGAGRNRSSTSAPVAPQ